MAGYTPGDAPYGVTWEEMGLEGLESWQSLNDLEGEAWKCRIQRIFRLTEW